MSASRSVPRPLALAVLSAALACQPAPDAIEPVKIGVLNPMSGDLGSLGPDWENASRLAAEQINSAGGLFDGRPLELLFYDTGTTPQGAVSATRKAMDDGAVALVGPASSAEASATLDVVAGYRVPQVSCCATSPSLTAKDDWFFRTTPNDLLQAQAVAYLAAEGWPPADPAWPYPTSIAPRAPCPEAAIVYRDDAYGTDLANVFRQHFETRRVRGTNATGRIVADVSYPADAPNGATVAAAFTNQLNAAHDPNVSDLCVLLVSFAPDGATVIKALEPALGGLAGDPAAFSWSYLATDGLFDDAFALDAGGFATKVVGTAPTHAENMAYVTFANAFRARFGEEPGNLTSNMYDAVMLLGLAITASRSTTGSDIRDALFDVSRGGRRFVTETTGAFFGEMAEALLSGEDIDYVGPSGELDFDDNGDVVGDFGLWQPTYNGPTLQIVEKDFLPSSAFAR